jgi:hypothetical protein
MLTGLAKSLKSFSRTRTRFTETGGGGLRSIVSGIERRLENMKIICQECHREIGEKFPFDDPRVTHTICPQCMEKRIQPDKKD